MRMIMLVAVPVTAVGLAAHSGALPWTGSGDVAIQIAAGNNNGNHNTGNNNGNGNTGNNNGNGNTGNNNGNGNAGNGQGNGNTGNGQGNGNASAGQSAPSPGHGTSGQVGGGASDGDAPENYRINGTISFGKHMMVPDHGAGTSHSWQSHGGHVPPAGELDQPGGRNLPAGH